MFALLLLLICLATFLQNKPVQFSYGESTCTNQLTFLPGLNKLTNNDSSFAINNSDFIKIGNVRLFSLKTCFLAKKAPSAGSVSLSVSLFGSFLAQKTYKLNVPQPPTVQSSVLSQPISTVEPLKMTLSNKDAVFDYQLDTEDKTTACPANNSAIYCNIASLQLLHGQKYDVKLVRTFEKQKNATLIDKTISTVNPTTIINSSISQGQIVYDKPNTFTFDFDKDIVKGDVKLEKVDGDKHTVVASQMTIDGKQIKLTIQEDLGRGSTYEFTIDKVESKDSSTLLTPYVLSFSASSGPSVSAVSVDSFGIPQTKTLVLTFDQTLSDDQDITKFVSTSGVSTTISKTDNQVFISYANSPICTDIGINVGPGLQSNYGVTQDSSWSFTTRTICHTVSTIGYSVEGRPILAYTFGSGSQTILYTGAIHGNELSAKYLMDAWIYELELNARSIPSDRKIVVVPAINPDGVAADRRSNSDNVDLNRNFPTDDWQTDIYSVTNQLIPGGGASPLSEPETQALAAFTISLQPRLTMSFHSSASYAIGNQNGDSAALADTYGQLTGYRNMTGVGGAFSYPITGTYDDWMRERCGLTSVLVELSSSVNSEFSRNKTALWTMARS
jgi:protein MpaA